MLQSEVEAAMLDGEGWGSKGGVLLNIYPFSREFSPLFKIYRFAFITKTFLYVLTLMNVIPSLLICRNASPNSNEACSSNIARRSR